MRRETPRCRRSRSARPSVPPGSGPGPSRSGPDPGGTLGRADRLRRHRGVSLLTRLGLPHRHRYSRRWRLLGHGIASPASAGGLRRMHVLRAYAQRHEPLGDALQPGDRVDHPHKQRKPAVASDGEIGADVDRPLRRCRRRYGGAGETRRFLPGFRPSRYPSIMPAGPPPTMQHRTFMERAGARSDILESMTRLSRQSPANDCSVTIRPGHMASGREFTANSPRLTGRP